MWFKWVLIGWFLLDTALSIECLGRGRITPRTALAVFAMDALFITGLLYFWR